MTVVRRVGAALSMIVVTMGTAQSAWASTPTMSGHYIAISRNAQSGQSVTEDWYFTSCGDGCADVRTQTGQAGSMRAVLANGQWTIDVVGTSRCLDGSEVPKSLTSHFAWDPNTLGGKVTNTLTKAACGSAAGDTYANDFQLTQAS